MSEIARDSKVSTDFGPIHFFFYKKPFYKKVSLRFAEKLRNPKEIFEAQMKIPIKKVRRNRL